MSKILMVEDDKAVIATVTTYLKHEHYTVEVAEDGGEGLALLRAYKYDVVILDWELPTMSGVELCRDLRARGDTTPVIMLTGKRELDDKEKGLDAGADDYLTKPFHVRELSARLRALTRRAVQGTENVLRVGDVVVDPAKYRVTVGGADVLLAKTEFALLEFFMRHPEQVFTPEALLERVWSSSSNATTETVRTYVKRLRQKIDTEGRPEMIHTVHGAGYVFRAAGESR
jgi:two-component system, OmpR family, response regulator MprA